MKRLNLMMALLVLLGLVSVTVAPVPAMSNPIRVKQYQSAQTIKPAAGFTFLMIEENTNTNGKSPIIKRNTPLQECLNSNGDCSQSLIREAKPE